MLAILIAWSIFTVIFLAFGSMSATLWNKLTRQKGQYNIVDSFWIGLCTVAAITCIASLFVPISIHVLAVVVSVSVIYWIVKRKELCQGIRNTKSKFDRSPLWARIFILSIFVILVASAIKPITLFDFGLYHEQYMIWNEQYSIIPGLGNIHGRFAFNSNFILLSTLVSYHPTYYLAFFPLNLLCMTVFSGWMIYKAGLERNKALQVILIAIVGAFFYMFYNVSSSTSTDILPGILVIYLLFNIVFDKQKPTKHPLLFILAAASCVTFKLSSAPILLCIALLMTIQVKNKEWTCLSATAILSAIVIIPWLARFVILSGYLAYPYPSIDLFSFDWKIPIQNVINEKNLTQAWARIPYSNYRPEAILAMPLNEWIPIWLKGKDPVSLLLYVMAAASPLPAILSIKQYRRNYLLSTAWAIALAGAIFGFMNAPDIRFTVGFIFCSAFIPIYVFAKQSQQTEYIANRLPGISAIIASVMLLAMSIFTYKDIKNNMTPETSLYTLSYKPLPTVKFKLFDYTGRTLDEMFYEKAENGFTLYSPAMGDQCFDHALPCTVRGAAKQNIEMRGKTFQDGFRIKQ